MSQYANPQNDGPVQTPKGQPETESQTPSQQFMQDNRPEAVAQRKLQASLNTRPVSQFKSLQRAAGDTPRLSFTEAKDSLIAHTRGRGADVGQFRATIQSTAPEARSRIAADPSIQQLLESELDGGELEEVMAMLVPASNFALPPEKPEVTATMQRLEAGVPAALAPQPNINDFISPI